MSDPVPPPPPPPFSTSQTYNQYDQQQSAPALPPLPPDFRVEDRSFDYESPPHFSDPLAAPRPQRVDPSIPGNMARTLDDQLGASYLDTRLATPAPPPSTGINYNPGFTSPYSPSSPPMPQWSAWGVPNSNAAYGQPQPPPPPPQAALSPAQVYQAQVTSGYGTPPQQSPSPANLSPAMAALSFSSSPPNPRHQSSLPGVNPPQVPSPTRSSGGPTTLTAPLPTIPTLSNAITAIQNPSHDPSLKIAWCRDVVFLVNRAQQLNSSTDPAVGPVRINDPQLLRLSQIAVPLILQLASPNPMPNPMPAHVAEAIYLRATFAASGGFPDQVQYSLRTAFRDFETAARGGYAAAWFRLGRDYEGFNDFTHAKDCFERGVKLGVESCTYRMGMAHLMGQLGLPSNLDLAIPLLHRAAILASIDVPQPAYVFGLLLLNEFAQVTVPAHAFTPFIPPGSSAQSEARRHLERAAYLNFAPAQYKLGHAYEFAQPPFLFDPLLSVQYYSLASQQGETEADMALSKWFLCGAEGAFDKDEALAYTFAEKAARKGLPSAEFALGYYAEVGVGGPKDIEAARRYYQQAADHGNTDAVERLRALSQPSPLSLTRQEHDAITETKLVRKRTQAKQRSDSLMNSGAVPAQQRMQERPDGRQLINVIRKNSMLTIPESGGPGPTPGMPAPQSIPQTTPLQPRPHHNEHQQTMPLPQSAQHRPRPLNDPHRTGSSPGGPGMPGMPSNPPSANTSPRLRPQGAGPGGPGGPGARPQSFSLTDPGSGSASPAGSGRPMPSARPTGGPGGGPGGGPQSNLGGGRPQGRPGTAEGRITSGAGGPPAAATAAAASPPAPKPSKPAKPGPATFAEMGIATSKVESDKDCVIM